MSLFFEYAALFPQEENQNQSLHHQHPTSNGSHPRKRLKRDENAPLPVVVAPDVEAQVQELMSVGLGEDEKCEVEEKPKGITPAASSPTNATTDSTTTSATTTTTCDHLQAELARLEALRRQMNDLIDAKIAETKRAMANAAFDDISQDVWLHISDYLSDPDLLNLQDASRKTFRSSSNDVWDNPHRHPERFRTGRIEEDQSKKKTEDDGVANVQLTKTTRRRRALRFRKMSEEARRLEAMAKKYYVANDDATATTTTSSNHDDDDDQSCPSTSFTSWPTRLYTKQDFCRDYDDFQAASHNFRTMGRVSVHPHEFGAALPPKEFFVRVTYRDPSNNGNHDNPIVLLEGFRPPVVPKGDNPNRSFSSMGGLIGEDNDSTYLFMRFVDVPLYDPKMLGIAEKQYDGDRRLPFLERWPAAARKAFLDNVSVTILACDYVHNDDAKNNNNNNYNACRRPELVVATEGYHDWALDMGILSPRPREASCRVVTDLAKEDSVRVGLVAIESGFGVFVEWKGVQDDWY